MAAVGLKKDTHLLKDGGFHRGEPAKERLEGAPLLSVALPEHSAGLGKIAGDGRDLLVELEQKVEGAFPQIERRSVREKVVPDKKAEKDKVVDHALEIQPRVGVAPAARPGHRSADAAAIFRSADRGVVQRPVGYSARARATEVRAAALARIGADEDGLEVGGKVLAKNRDLAVSEPQIMLGNVRGSKSNL